MSERLLHRLGSKYIPFMLVLTRLLGVGGGALTIYYLSLVLELNRHFLIHWLGIGAAVVVFDLSRQIIMGLWETKDLRLALDCISKDAPIPADSAERISRSVIAWPYRHNVRTAFIAPFDTTLPACLYMYLVMNAPQKMLLHIFIAANIGTIAAIFSIYCAMEHMMRPVWRVLSNKGVHFDYKSIPVSRLGRRMMFSFTMIIIMAVLMIAVLANQKALDISQSPEHVNELLHSIQIHSGGISFGAIVIALFLSAMLARTIASRAQQMVKAMEHVERGDLTEQIEAFANDEIGILGRSFNKMVRQLKRDHDTIDQKNVDLQQAYQEVEEVNRELEQTNEQLQEAIERAYQMAVAAQAANKAKTQFLANMSHEIRTPLTAILGYIDLLGEECPRDCEFGQAEYGEYLGTLSRNARHLLDVVSDILDISKIEADRLAVEQIRISPHELIADIGSSASNRAHAKGVKFEVQYEGAIPETIETDPTRLRQILMNVVLNAIKFTESGSVHLITRLNDTGDVPLMEFDVLDTGIGMTEEQVEAVFQPFVQADTTTTRKFGGTGLGLTISRRLAEMLGGGISVVETAVGVGTRFRVSVPVGSLEGVKMVSKSARATIVKAESSAPTDASDDRPTLDQCRILLAEDGPDNQRLISYLLGKVGAKVTVVDNGKLALEAALEARDAGQPFDVVLMDMQMPVMDGYAATRTLRKHGYTHPIIALTAHAMTRDRQRCLDAGCDEYATKPIDRTLLFETIKGCLGKISSKTGQLASIECS